MRILGKMHLKCCAPCLTHPSHPAWPGRECAVPGVTPAPQTGPCPHCWKPMLGSSPTLEDCATQGLAWVCQPEGEARTSSWSCPGPCGCLEPGPSGVFLHSAEGRTAPSWTPGSEHSDPCVGGGGRGGGTSSLRRKVTLMDLFL